MGVKLPNGAMVLARLAAKQTDGATQVSALDELDFDDVGRALEGMAETVWTAVKKVSPEKVTLELGLDLAVKNGKLVGLVVEGEGKGSIAVTLEWGATRE